MGGQRGCSESRLVQNDFPVIKSVSFPVIKSVSASNGSAERDTRISTMDCGHRTSESDGSSSADGVVFTHVWETDSKLGAEDGADGVTGVGALVGAYVGASVGAGAL
jgi:hypothetical protein